MIEAFPERADQPSVTILMASYDRLDLIKASVRSALDQLYDNFEIIIVDDGSGAKTIGWLKQLETNECKVTVYYQNHQGVAKTRAFGIEKATTELVCILDSDDILVPEALEKLVSATCRNPDTALFHCDIREVRGNGATRIRRYHSYASTSTMILATLLKPRVPFKHSGTIFRRQTILELGSYNRNLPCKIDVDLYLNFLKAGHLPGHIAEPLVDFRMHKNSVSIDRLLGIKVWLYLIDHYGPANPIARFLIKAVRVSAELAKRAYLELSP